MDSQFKFDVAISFAGEDRTTARELADTLTANGVKVFYDEFHLLDLWGKNLVEFFQDTYMNQARFFIPLLSAHYAEKAWPSLEKQSALARTMQTKGEYILPLRLDDTQVPGILPTVGYLDLRQINIDRVVELVLHKLGRTESKTMDDRTPVARLDIPMPTIQPKPTQRDKDLFAQESFHCIREYFRQGLEDLERHAKDLQSHLREIHSEMFIATIYRGGNLGNKCKVWIGGLFGANSIAYREGADVTVDNNSMNDSLSVEEAKGTLGLKPSGMWMGGPQTKDLLSQEKAAEYLWRRFTERLSR